MRLTKHGKKWTQETLARTTKMREIGWRTWEITLYREEIGMIEKERNKYHARNMDGAYLGNRPNKKEARLLVALHFVGQESMKE